MYIVLVGKHSRDKEIIKMDVSYEIVCMGIWYAGAYLRLYQSSYVGGED